jgi:surfactin synthase thioesterase subunit
VSEEPRWFVPLEPRPDAALRLVAFPHAGAGPAAVAGLLPWLPAEVELRAVSLPGRQARLREAPRTDLEPLAAELAAHLAPEAGPVALFGYCGGALLAYLVARQLEAAGTPPRRLLVGSFAAPDVAPPPGRLHLLPSDRFWERVVDQGGVPEELARRVELRPLFEPALRADFALLAGYRHRPAPPMGVPISVLHGRLDGSLSRGALLGWRRQTRHPLSLRELEASHWLLEEAPADLARALVDEVSTPS